MDGIDVLRAVRELLTAQDNMSVVRAVRRLTGTSAVCLAAESGVLARVGPAPHQAALLVHRSLRSEPDDARPTRRAYCPSICRGVPGS